MYKTLNTLILMLAGIVIPGTHSHAQQKKFYPETLTFRTGNISSSFPIMGSGSLFVAPYRPYFEISASKSFGKKPKKVWEHELNLGYFYHRFMQHGIPLHYNVVRRFSLGEKIGLGAKVGAGYFQSISAAEKFKLNDQGEFERVKFPSKAQVMFDLGLECKYRLNDQFQLGLQYKTLIQAPFIKSYVPMLPYNSLQLGLSYALNSASK